MSKSLGNLYTIEDLEAKGHTAGEVRYVLASGYYRQQLNFTLDTLNAAKQALGRLAKVDKGLAAITNEESAPSYEDALSLAGKPLKWFGDAFGMLLEDLNTPAALGKMFVQLKEIERRLSAGDIQKEEAASMRSELHFILSALGISLPEEQEVSVPSEILELASNRWEAKQNKNWADADALRNQVTEAGWQIKDRPDGFDVLPL